MDPVILTISSVFAVSLVSLVGIAAFSLEEKTLRKALFALVGLAAGALLGNAIIHLIPESLEVIGDGHLFGFAVLSGLLLFFFLEKGLRWHHAHHAHEHEHMGHEQYERGTHGHLAPMVIVADGLHNALDGAVIAASFLVSPALGATTTLAVFLHEIPQEIADYALLLHSGLSRGMALFYNFLSGAMGFLGAGLVLWLGSTNELFGAYVAAATAGAFIYLAATDLIPEITKNHSAKRSALEVSAFLVGIGLMFALALVEPH